jgi:Ca2+-binding RTX toxin-like protein
MKNNYGHGGTGDYWNGDGFVAEADTYNLTFQDTLASGNTDTGYDLKSDNTKLIRATGIDNGKNFRLWGDNVVVTDSVSTNPRHFGGIGKTSHLWAANGADVTLDNFRYSDTTGTTEVFDLSDGANTLNLVDMAMPAVARIHFGNNSMIKLPTGLVVNGTAGNDSLAGGTGNDMLIGGKGNDTYVVNATGDKPVEQGTEGTDLVKATLGSYTLADHVENLSYAGSGNFNGVGNNLNNAITGGAGNDRLDGMMGNDTLTGGQGADTYVYGSGSKQDTIYNSDSGAPDKLVFKSGITETELWFGKTGNDLLVTLRGTGNTDSVRLKNWYSDSASHLSQFQLSDGSVLEASHVQQIVQAMASFTTSAGGPVSLTGTQEQTVDTVIAANWHPAT